MAAEITLTPEQEKLVLDAFNKDPKNAPAISDLVKLAFPNLPENVSDGRSIYGKAIKQLLATKGLKAKTLTVYTPVDKITLTDNQKLYIKNNLSNEINPLGLARDIFQNQLISNLSMETRAVAEYVREISTNNQEAAQAAQDVPLEDYAPPRTVNGALQRVDKYVFTHGINKDNMTAQQKAGLEALLAYMNTVKFVHQINLYESQSSRDLFESSFVRYCYNKPDLHQEEVDSFVNVSHYNAALAATQARIERLAGLMDDITNNNPDERARLSMSLVEALETLNTEYNQMSKLQQNLLNDLKEKRSERMEAMKAANASILNLVQLWADERSRKKLLHLADARKKVLEKSAQEFSGMEEIKLRILGLNPEELIHSSI